MASRSCTRAASQAADSSWILIATFASSADGGVDDIRVTDLRAGIEFAPRIGARSERVSGAGSTANS